MRIFAALRLAPDLATELARAAHAALGSALDELRVVQPGDLHLTLHFLGETPEARAELLRPALERALAGARAPQLRLCGTGGFPDGRRARVLWAAVQEEPHGQGRLVELHERVLAAVGEVGHPLPNPPEPLVPHVTLARPRSRGGLALPRAFRELALDLSWRPTEVALLESRPVAQGTRYPSLQAWPLA